MKFWQKILLWTLLIFIFVFDVGAYILTTHSYTFSRQREFENAAREQSVILSSVTGRISSAETIYADAASKPQRLAAMVKPLMEYYAPQGVCLALFSGKKQVCSNLKVLHAQVLQLADTETKNTVEEMVEGKRYVLVASKLPDYPHLTLVYARDISQIDLFRKEVSRIFIFVNAGAIVLMGFAIYFLLRHFTKPIDALRKTTAEIAGGAYDKRVTLHGRDEFGMLAENFNLMADSVEQHMDKLTQAAADRQQFIDDLTHEMKTPMTSILGYTEYLQHAKSTKEERQLAALHLHDAALRLKNLSDKLLELVYLRGEKIVMQEVAVKPLFEALASVSQPVLEERNLLLQTETEIAFVRGDEVLLLSMLRNLVENAAKASAAGSQITVRAYRGDVTVIEVCDTGFGMEPSEVEKITAPFYRVDRSRARKFGGVGLGLSIVSQIVKLHGAHLTIDSVPGQGTRVRIDFTDC